MVLSAFLLSLDCMFRLYKGAPPFGVFVNVSFHYTTKNVQKVYKTVLKRQNTTEMSFYNIYTQKVFYCSKF